MARPNDLIDVPESGYVAVENGNDNVQSNRPTDLISVDPDYVGQQINPYNAVTGATTGAAIAAPVIEKKILGVDPHTGRSLETYLRTQRHHDYPGLDLKGLQTEWQKIAGPNARIVTMEDVQEALKATRPVDLSAYKTAPQPTTAAGRAAQPVKKLGEVVEQLNPFLGHGYGSRAFRGAGRAGLGFGAAYEGAQAYNKALEGDVSGAAGSASTGAGLGLMAVPNPYAKGAGAILAGVPFASSLMGTAQAAPMSKEEAGGTAFDIGTGLLGPAGMMLTPSELGRGTLRKRDEAYRPGLNVLEDSRLLPQQDTSKALLHFADGGFVPNVNLSAQSMPNMTGQPGVGYMNTPQAAMARFQLQHELENQARLRAGATGMGMAIPGQQGVKLMPGQIEAGANMPVGPGHLDVSGFRSINPVNMPAQRGGHMFGGNLRYTIPFAEGGGVAPYGFRHVENVNDVSLPKGSGWFGHLPNQSGQISTEISADSNGMQYPLLNPMMNRQDINSLLANQQPTDDMYKKAEQWAKYRKIQGKSPFISPVGEMRWPLPKQ
jgi:hypothetical protein